MSIQFEKNQFLSLKNIEMCLFWNLLGMVLFEVYTIRLKIFSLQKPVYRLVVQLTDTTHYKDKFTKRCKQDRVTIRHGRLPKQMVIPSASLVKA